MVERRDWCGCVTGYDPPPPVVEGVPYVDEPMQVRAFAPCARHADWVEALAESCACGYGLRRLAEAGIEHVDYHHDGTRLIFVTTDPIPLGLRATLNATELAQDYRNGTVPDEHQERFNALVVAHLLACRLQSR